MQNPIPIPIPVTLLTLLLLPTILATPQVSSANPIRAYESQSAQEMQQEQQFQQMQQSGAQDRIKSSLIHQSQQPSGFSTATHPPGTGTSSISYSHLDPQCKEFVPYVGTQDIEKVCQLHLSAKKHPMSAGVAKPTASGGAAAAAAAGCKMFMPYVGSKDLLKVCQLHDSGLGGGPTASAGVFAPLASGGRPMGHGPVVGSKV